MSATWNVRRCPSSGDDAGNMRSVPIIVVLFPGDETLAIHHPRLPSPRGEQIGMGIDTAVNDRYTYARAIPTRVPCNRRVDPFGAVVQRSTQRPVQRDVADVGLIGERDHVS